MPRELKVVVFDLDGTLADTLNITLLNPGTRSPYDVLNLTPPMDNQKRLLFDNSVIYKISYLIQCGICVYLITRAPKPYASTLTYLMGIDFCGLIPSNPTLTTVASKLEHISKITGADKSEMLYLGDLEEDRDQAKEFGCFFQYPPWARGHSGKTDQISGWFQRCYGVVAEKGESYVTTDILKTKHEERIQQYESIASLLEHGCYFNDQFALFDYEDKMILDDVFRIPNVSDLVMKPFVNPHIFTKFEYESDDLLRYKLFELIKLAEFAPQLINPPSFDGTDVLLNLDLYASVDYWSSNGFGSALWGLIKNWSQAKGSGPKVHLHYLELVALGISAGIYARRSENDSEFAFLVPIPSTRISPEHPGQVSFRLVHRISQLTEIPLLNLLTKNESGEISPTMARYPFSRPIYLIDDQITSGKNARKCVDVLREMGVGEIKIFTWSASKFELVTA
jgi:hypothetical protein